MSAHRIPADSAKAGWVLDSPATATALGISKVSQHKLLVGSGAETNTCADPQKAGLRKVLVCVTNGGGTRAVTFATAFNAAGNTVITFSAVKQTAFLESVPDGSTASGYRWQLIANVGAALS
jgi:hypothetical protein